MEGIVEGGKPTPPPPTTTFKKTKTISIFNFAHGIKTKVLQCVFQKDSRETYSGSFCAEVVVCVAVGQHEQQRADLVLDVVVRHQLLFQQHEQSRLCRLTNLLITIIINNVQHTKCQSTVH